MNGANNKIKIYKYPTEYWFGYMEEVYILSPGIIRLKPEVDKGRLTYRLKGSVKRYSYNQIKRNLIKTNKCIAENYPDWIGSVTLL